jgi:predicted glycosyl hydrolase (DUF1957 family)
MTTYWAPLLHIYQPPFQDCDILKRINEECYLPLFNTIKEHDNSKFSLNICGSLIEMLETQNYETLNTIKDLVNEGKLELLGTAKYHPLLPLIPEKEARRQIDLNEQITQKFFKHWQRKGFFPPEMAINSKLIKLLHDLNYDWVIMSGIACPNDWPYDKIYSSSNGLKFYFRDDILSNKISFNNITAELFLEELKTIHPPKSKIQKDDSHYVITAMDGETFGHHVKNYHRVFLSKILSLLKQEVDVKLEFISDLKNHFQVNESKINPQESSWSTTEDDLRKKIPFPLWYHPQNNIHQFYWKMFNSLNHLISLIDDLDLMNDLTIQNYYNTARWYYDKSICSDTTWWANPERGMWSPNLIYKGVDLMVSSALNAQLALTYANNQAGESHFDSICYYQGLILMELYNFSKKYGLKSS